MKWQGSTHLFYHIEDNNKREGGTFVFLIKRKKLSRCIALLYHQECFWQCHFVLIKALGGKGRPEILYSGQDLVWVSEDPFRRQTSAITPVSRCGEKGH